MSQLGLLSVLSICHLTFMVSSTLVPPRNVTLISENFQHVLTWAEENNKSSIYYNVQYEKTGQHGGRLVSECSNITIQHCDLTAYLTDIEGIYKAAAQCFTDKESSAWSWSRELVPIEETLLGPLIVDVFAYETTINITIQPPISHLRSQDGKSTMSMLQDDVYPVLTYTIQVVQPDEKPWPFANLTEDVSTENFSIAIPNLLPSTNYCISAFASASANLNTHQKPSALKCVITKPSPMEAGNLTMAYITGAIAVAVVLIAFLPFLIALDRSGYICTQRTFPPEVLESFPKSNSVYKQNAEFVCPAYVVPVQVIIKPPEEESSESDEESCGHAYTERKRLFNLECDRYGGDSSCQVSYTNLSLKNSTGQDSAKRLRLGVNAKSNESRDDSGLTSSASSSLMESSSQDCTRTTEQGNPKEYPPILHNPSSVSNSPLHFSDFITNSSIPLNRSEPFHVKLNSVLVRSPEDFFNDLKVVIPKEDQETSSDLYESTGPPQPHGRRPFTQSDELWVLPSDESSGEEDLTSNDASEPDEHLVSGYMSR